MASTELPNLERVARRRYEWARVWRSCLAMAPALVVVAVAMASARRPLSALGFGAAMLVCGAVLLWRGEALKRGVLPGLLTGLIPLAAALVANRGHGCGTGHCSTVCMQACIAGGIAAGLLASVVLSKRRLAWPAWGASAAVCFLTGAMGCACVGYSGVLGLAAGFVGGAAPLALRRVFARS